MQKDLIEEEGATLRVDNNNPICIPYCLILDHFQVYPMEDVVFSLQGTVYNQKIFSGSSGANVPSADIP